MLYLIRDGARQFRFSILSRHGAAHHVNFYPIQFGLKPKIHAKKQKIDIFD